MFDSVANGATFQQWSGFSRRWTCSLNSMTMSGAAYIAQSRFSGREQYVDHRLYSGAGEERLCGAMESVEVGYLPMLNLNARASMSGKVSGLGYVSPLPLGGERGGGRWGRYRHIKQH